MTPREIDMQPEAESREPGNGGPHEARERDEAAGEVPPPTAGTAAEPAGEAVPAQESERELKDRWLRAEAELQNFRRRAQRDLEESTRFAEERVLLEMISFLDDLERAIAAAGEAGSPGPWLEGVTLVARRMGEYLARHGVTPVEPHGERFDPVHHEALLEIEAPAGIAPGHVVEVVRKGYRRHERPLRAARVVVAKQPEGGK